MTGVRKCGWGLFTAVLIFLLIGKPASAAPASIVLQESDWRTGALEINYTGATPGYVLQLWTADHNDPDAYHLRDIWIADSDSGSHITNYLENGQTIWYYVVQRDPVTGEDSPQSNALKQTPPVTVFVINWPDMLDNLKDAIKDSDDYMSDKLDGLATPSDDAMQGLIDAVNELKDALGAGQAVSLGNDLANQLNAGQAGMSSSIINNDGVGVYSGGHTGGQLPATPTTGDSGLTYPNPDSGTDTGWSFRIPYGVDMQGNLLYLKLFTQEQMEKFKWLDVLKYLAGCSVYIEFLIWLIKKFSPAPTV